MILHYLKSRGEKAGYFHMKFKGFSIGYRGNWEAYTTPTRTLFDRLTLFVYDPSGYPSDVYTKSKAAGSIELYRKYAKLTKMGKPKLLSSYPPPMLGDVALLYALLLDTRHIH